LTAPLAADGRELYPQGFYRIPVSGSASIYLGAMLRLPRDNMRSAAPDGVVMAQFKAKF
jgi:hypothetical protein